MKRLIFLLFVLICSFSYGQTYQSMPQAGYGPVKRMLFDSVVTLPMGITSLRNITGGRDTAQIRYNKNDSSLYVYTGTQWVKASGASIDTSNIWISAVSKPNDSSLSFTKGTTVTTYSISTVTSAKRLATLVYNNTGTTIFKGSIVYINGRHSSNLPTIALAQANDEANSYKTFAITAEDITTSNSGLVIQAGNITGLNLPTSSYADGDIVYLSPTTAGGITTSKPLAPYHICKIGSITRAHPTLGSIEVKIENGWQLDELSDVQVSAVPLDSTILQFSRTDSLWHAVTMSNVLNPRLNQKLNTSDSIIYFSKFRSDTMRSNIYTALGGEQDTTTSWKTGGNFNVNAGQFIGSRNNASLRFRTNNTERVVVDSIGSVGIGTSLAAASSLVDITSTSKGLLIPRMTTTQRNAISTPATGLQVYDLTDSSNYTYDGTRWNRQLSANGLQTITGTSQSGSNAIGVLDLSQTWNTTGNPTALKINVTNTASGASAKLFDLQTGGTSRFFVDKTGNVELGNNRIQNSGNNSSITLGNASMTMTVSSANSAISRFTFALSGGNAPTSGTENMIISSPTYNPTSGTAIFNGFVYSPALNQTGGASGISRGLYVNPTLTAAADFRGIEISNGSIVLPYSAQTGTYAVKTSDYLINVTSGTFTATLPTAVGCTGKNYIIKNSGSGAVTVGTTSSQTIDGSTTYSLGTQYKYVHVVSNGANWIITANN